MEMKPPAYWQYVSALAALQQLMSAHFNRHDDVLMESIQDAIASAIDAARQLRAHG